MKKIRYEITAKIVNLSGACFWYWGDFYHFLDSCGVPKDLQNKYPRDSFNKYNVMKNIIYELEATKQMPILQQIIANFYKLKLPVNKENLDIEKAKTLLAEFKDSVGNDPIEFEMKEKEKAQKIKNAREANEAIQLTNIALGVIKQDFYDLFGNKKISPQQRGFELEKIFHKILDLEELESKKPYKADGEQIDGQLKFEKFDYLIEIKWEKGKMKQSDLSIFDGKIRGKAQSTRGLFFAINGFDDNAIRKFSGDSPKMILMDGFDFMEVLEGRKSFYDCIKMKVNALVTYGSIMSK
jgi:hypothetical protein